MYPPVEPDELARQCVEISGQRIKRQPYVLAGPRNSGWQAGPNPQAPASSSCGGCTTPGGRRWAGAFGPRHCAA